MLRDFSMKFVWHDDYIDCRFGKQKAPLKDEWILLSEIVDREQSRWREKNNLLNFFGAKAEKFAEMMERNQI